MEESGEGGVNSTHITLQTTARLHERDAPHNIGYIENYFFFGFAMVGFTYSSGADKRSHKHEIHLDISNE